MHKTLILVASIVAVALMSVTAPGHAADNQQLTHSKWQGAATLPNSKKLTLELELFRRSGFISANVRSPDQGIQNIPATQLTLTADSLAMELPTLRAQLSLQQSDNGCYTGELNQGVAMPVTLCPTDQLHHDQYLAGVPETVVEQPQLVFQSNDGTELSGTLYSPTQGDFDTVVILAQGSGPVDRDGSFGPHKLYRNLAINMAAEGVAVFAYDKRGIRQSGGDYSSAEATDYAHDLSAAYRFIADHFAPQHIGLMGHSEGASVVAMAASQVKPALAISLGGVGLNGVEAIVLQDKTESMAAGATAAQAELLQQIARRYYTIVLEAENEQQRSEQINAYLATLSAAEQAVYQQYGANSYTLASRNANDAALYSILATDPTQYWRQVCAPVLVLNGSTDVQVPAAENVAGIAAALAICPHENSEQRILANYNHMFQYTENGGVAEYRELPEGFQPEIVATIVAWIHGVTR